MKTGWQKKRFKDVAEVIGGATPLTNVAEYWNGGHFWISPAELHGEKWVDSTVKTITDSGVKSAHLRELPEGTVLLSSRAPIGKVAITKVPMYCNQGFKNIVCSKNLNNVYVYYYLLFQKDYLNSIGTGATFKEISKRVVENVEIVFPSIDEQKRIIEILDKGFARIDTLKTNAEKSLKNAQELFETELSSTLNRGSRDAEILCLCSKVSNIKWNKEQGQLNYVDLSSVSRDTFQIEETQQICASNAPSRAKQILHDGDVIFGTTRPTLKRLCVVPKDYDKQICSTGFVVIRPQKEKVVSKWIFFNLLSKDFYAYIEPIQRGATYPAVSDKDVKQFKIWLPDLNQQKTILASLERLEKNCKKLQSNYEKTIALCDDLKQSLLGKAFNGEL